MIIPFVRATSKIEKMKVTFIVNPISGTKSKQHILDIIPNYFDSNELAYEILKTEYAGHAKELAMKAAQEGAKVVVAVGGDGTVNEVASGLIHTESALGIIPCGSGNGLARHLGIPMKPEGALKVLKEMDIRQCDYGTICGHPFFCTAGVGFDAEVSDTFANAGKRGLITYFKTTISVGLKYKGDVYEIDVTNDGETETIPADRYWLITAGNAAQYGNDFYITPDASICDGKLDVNLWTTFNKLAAPIVGVQLAKARINHNSHVHIISCDKIVIRRKDKGPIQWDGDPAEGPREITMECIKNGIKMVVGKPRKNQL